MMELPGIITLGAALLPTIVIMVIVLANAKTKREPFKKVASVFAISALSVIPAAILEGIGVAIAAIVLVLLNQGTSVEYMDEFTMTCYYAFEYLFIVGLAEEACKYFTFKWIIFHDREFDNTYDGVIYGAASALGFATLENLMYVFLDNDSPLQTALMRAILSVPMHAVTGIVMGYYFGISKYRKYNNVNANTHPERKAFIFSVILHGVYDFWVTMPAVYEDMSDTLEYGVLALIMLFIYILVGRTIHLAKKQIHAIYNAYYYEHLGGRFQDMLGGKTSDKKPAYFLGVPLPMMYARTGGFNPYNPYASMGMPPPPPPVYGQNPYQPVYPQQNPYVQPVQPGYAPMPPQGQPVQPIQPVQQMNPAMPMGGQPQGFGQPYSPTPAPQYQQPQPQQYLPQQNQQTRYPQTAPVSAYVPPARPAVISCSNCGARARSGQSYCSTCGSKLHESAQNGSFS